MRTPGERPWPANCREHGRGGLSRLVMVEVHVNVAVSAGGVVPSLQGEFGSEKDVVTVCVPAVYSSMSSGLERPAIYPGSKLNGYTGNTHKMKSHWPGT